MLPLLKWGVAAIVVAFIIYYCQLKDNNHTQIAAVSEPHAVDNLFEHVILDAQQHQQFTTTHAQQTCIQSTACKEHAALFAKYLSFKQAIAELQLTFVNLPLSEQLKHMLDFQSSYFSEAEIALLFSDDNQWQRYTIAKLEINQNSSLNKAIKQQLLANLEGSLPDHITHALKPSKDLHTLNNDLAEAFESQNYNELTDKFGDAAATRLIALQQQRQQWHTLTEHLSKKIAWLNQHYDPQQANQMIAQLLDQHLTTNQKRRFLVLYQLD